MFQFSVILWKVSNPEHVDCFCEPISLVSLCILKMSLHRITEECAIYELSNCERFESFMHNWVEPSKLKVVVGFEPWPEKPFLRTNRAISHVYILQMCRFYKTDQRVIFELWRRFKYVMDHCFQFSKKTFDVGF